MGAITGNAPNRFSTKRTEVRFVQPTGMKVSWFGMAANGTPAVMTKSVLIDRALVKPTFEIFVT